MTLSLFGSRSMVQTENGGRLQVVKYVTVHGKCSAISDGDWQVFPFIFYNFTCTSSYNTNWLYIQICTNLRLADTTKKTSKSIKRASPLSPGTRECVHLVQKKIETRAVWFETRAHTISCFYQNHQDNHPRIETYTNPFPCHSQPLLCTLVFTLLEW